MHDQVLFFWQLFYKMSPIEFDSANGSKLESNSNLTKKLPYYRSQERYQETHVGTITNRGHFTHGQVICCSGATMEGLDQSIGKYKDWD
jgi:hypothetical protein